MSKDLSGQSIKGYELREAIGAGGFGQVYRAYQSLVKRDVAIKIILPALSNNPEFIRRFEIEAQLIARLEHIHIVPLYDYWREPDGAYLVMRWLRGGSLRTRLKTKPLTLDEITTLLDQVSSALATAHRRGVIHRDIKPDNILFDEDGNAYLADFGIAKDLETASRDEDEDEGLTGSPLYISPEQIESRPVSAQTDIYSLGMVLYELLTGAPAFVSDQGVMDIIIKHLNEPVPSLQSRRPDLPQALNAVIQRATAKTAEERFPDVLSMAMQFRSAIHAPEVTPLPQVIPSAGEDDILIFTTPISTLSGITINIDEHIDNPYKGLHAFQEADAADFYGREVLITQLLTRLGETGPHSRFLAVIGPSGSGKSSVVKAGVIPALRQGKIPGSSRWFLAEMVPGTNPFQELETALLSVAVDAPPGGLQNYLRQDENGLLHAVERVLPGKDTEMVLTIDQFEEIFTQVSDDDTREHFLNSLQAAVSAPHSRLRVIITLRADFYDRPLLYPGFGEMMRKRSEVVLPLSTDEMRLAIVGPAERAGLVVETSLLNAIITEVSEQPGALPLLQYTLTEMFGRRQSGVLTLESYRAIGGVFGSLARRAEELYTAMPPENQTAVRQIFLRLVTVGEGSEDTRRRALQNELLAAVDDDEIALHVIDTLGKYRLFTFDRDPETREPTIEVAHEALLREWSRLRQWLNESREDILLQRRLSTAAEEWKRVERNPSFLASGMRLSQFEQLHEIGSVSLTPVELDYLQASLADRDEHEAAERARLEHEELLERRSRDRLKALVGVFSIAAVITSFLAVVAFINFNTAQEQRDKAERNATVSNSLAMVSSANLELENNNNDLAIALALEANQISDPPIEAQRMLADAALDPGTRRVFAGEDDGAVFNEAVSPDGQFALAATESGSVVVWDTITAAPRLRFEGHQDIPVRSVAISPDGQTALSGDNEGVLLLWNVDTGEILYQLAGHEDRVVSVAFSGDGQKAISGDRSGVLLLWDVTTGTQIRSLEGHDGTIRSVALSPNGRTALSGGDDYKLYYWNTETGEILRTFEFNDAVWSVAFNADGTQALAGGGNDDPRIRLWDLESGDEVQRFQGHNAQIRSVAFSPIGGYILSASDDGTVRLWSLQTSNEVNRFGGHSGLITRAVFMPSGYQMLTSSQDGTLRLWDITNGAEIRHYWGHNKLVYSAEFSPDNTTILSSSTDGTVRLWDLTTGQEIRQYPHDAEVYSAFFSPDGQQFVSTSGSSVYVWDVTSGDIVYQLEGHEDDTFSAVFSPDGQTILSADGSGIIIQWDTTTGEQMRTLEGHEDLINSLAVSLDGQYAASGDNSGVIILWDLTTGDAVHTLSVNGLVLNVAFSSDGKTLASSSSNTLITLWDVTTGNKIRDFEGHTSTVNGVAFSDDGQTLVSSSDDGTLRVWNMATGSEIRRIHNTESTLVGIDFNTDGETVVTGAGNGLVQLWKVLPYTLEWMQQWTFDNRYVTSTAIKFP
jgi:WD40 repeat protein/serine/threonine protein kinase